MPKLSQKGQQMPSSPIRKLVPYAEAAKARGTHVYHLNIGQPDIKTPQAFWDKLKNPGIDVLAYCNSDGFNSYQQAWAKYYSSFGAQISADQVIVTTGASEALSIAKMSCLDPGDEIIIPEPLYANYIGFAEAGGVKIQPIPTSIEDGFALPSIEAFEERINERTKAILICNPNNPTGYLYNREELERLKEIVLKHDLYLMVDEVYREFTYDGGEHISILTFSDLDEHVVVFDSISKRFSACGARVGALITRNKALRDVFMKFAQARLSPPSLGQIAGEPLFDLPAEFYEEIRQEYDARRVYLRDRLQAMSGVTCPNPGGAFYIMVELPVDDSDKFCQWLLESFDHEGKTLMLAPGSGFYATDGSGTRQARVAYVLNQEDLGKAMDALEVALQQYPGKLEGAEAGREMLSS